MFPQVRRNGFSFQSNVRRESGYSVIFFHFLAVIAVFLQMQSILKRTTVKSVIKFIFVLFSALRSKNLRAEEERRIGKLQRYSYNYSLSLVDIVSYLETNHSTDWLSESLNIIFILFSNRPCQSWFLNENVLDETSCKETHWVLFQQRWPGQFSNTLQSFFFCGSKEESARYSKWGRTRSLYNNMTFRARWFKKTV